MSLLPETVAVDTSAVVALRDAADATVEWAAETDDAAALWDASRRAGVLERYVDDVETEKRLRWARGWTMAHLGRVLGDGPGHGPGRGNRPSPDGFLVPRQRVAEARRLRTWALDKGDADVVEALDAGMALAPILRMIAERTPVAAADADIVEGDRWRLIAGDFRDVCAEMPAESVDMIVTDPPYPNRDLPLYGALGAVARRLLTRRGLLLVVTGQLNLPAIHALLGEHMTYGWTFRLDLPGTNSRIMGRHLIQTWKPVLAYSTGTWPSGEWRSDRVISPAPDQDEHGWGQSVAPIVELVESFSRPDAIVLDTFTGGGAYGEAVLRAGRRFVGVELDAESFDTARRRLEGLPS